MGKSKIYSFRLHPSNEQELRAIEVLESLIEQGYSVREIVTDAVLRAEGYTPEMFANSDERVTRTYLETLLSEFGREILYQMGQVPAIHQKEKPSPFANDEDETMMQNIANGFLARRQRNNP